MKEISTSKPSTTSVPVASNRFVVVPVLAFSHPVVNKSSPRNYGTAQRAAPRIIQSIAKVSKIRTLINIQNFGRSPLHLSLHFLAKQQAIQTTMTPIIPRAANKPATAVEKLLNNRSLSTS